MWNTILDTIQQYWTPNFSELKFLIKSAVNDYVNKIVCIEYKKKLSMLGSETVLTERFF